MQTYVVSILHWFACLANERLLMHILMFPHRRSSQRCDGTEGVGGEAEAAAAGVCTQGEHSGDETCNEGAGDARVHSMYSPFLPFF